MSGNNNFLFTFSNISIESKGKKVEMEKESERNNVKELRIIRFSSAGRSQAGAKKYKSNSVKCSQVQLNA